jgi:AraC-like DNA-binding protein
MQAAAKIMPNATLSSPLARLTPGELTAAERKARVAERDAWVAQIDPSHLFHPLFDLLSGVSFFAKNRRGELMLMSRSNRDVYGITDPAQVVGLTDFDLNPADMARSYVADDERIFATGEPLLNRVEVWFDERGIPDWFVVNKLPIRGRDNSIVGVMGFSQSYEGRANLLEPFDGLAKAVHHIKSCHAETLSIGKLARIAGLSARQLQRKFKQVFGVGPHDFLIKTRLLAACRAIRDTDHSLGEIAFSCGFCDQSAFTRYFREHVGLTPRHYRLQLRGDSVLANA